MRRASRIHRAFFAAATFVVVAAVTVAPALAQSTPTPSPSVVPGPAEETFGDQVVLLGRVVVPRGQSVGEVIVFSGRVVVEGIVRGDVVVVDGPITVSGQVSGSVIALDGSVRLQATAQVSGDVLAHDRVIVAQGAAVEGRMTEGASFNLSRPLRAVAPFVSWIAVAVSTLLLGLLLVLLAPRGLDRTSEAGRTAPWASAGWGIALAIGIPVLAVFAVASVLGIPLGIGLLVGLVPAALFGVVVTAQTLGRAMVDPDRRRLTAFLAGWLLQTVIGVIPYASGAAFALSATFGLGATAVAVWRARGPRREVRPAGKHRAGATTAAPTESAVPSGGVTATPSDRSDPIEEREAPGL